MRYAGVIPNDIVNGVGICVSFWVQGCHFHCPGCHNPQTWNSNGGNELPSDYIQKVLKLITKNGVKRNLSILGGEPFDNVDVILPLVKEVKKAYPWIKIFVWTGYDFLTAAGLFPDILPYLDYVIDGQFEEDKRDVTLFLKGSTNQGIIKVPDYLYSMKQLEGKGVDFTCSKSHMYKSMA